VEGGVGVVAVSVIGEGVVLGGDVVLGGVVVVISGGSARKWFLRIIIFTFNDKLLIILIN
jgi:uncharacterized membrane protein YczE